MHRDELIRLAREAGATGYTNRHYPDRPHNTFSPEQLERFAALVAAAEREQCAKVCDGEYYQHLGPEYGEVRYGIAACAAVIRARKDDE